MTRKHKRPASRTSGFKKGVTLDEMLRVKSFAQLLKDGDIFDVQGAAAHSGYTPQHVRRLCREDRLPHIRRGVVEAEVCFYFYPWQLKELFSYRKAQA